VSRTTVPARSSLSREGGVGGGCLDHLPLTETPQGDWPKAARFYEKFGIAETVFRPGIPEHILGRWITKWSAYAPAQDGPVRGESEILLE
jgi:hypothetical protein